MCFGSPASRSAVVNNPMTSGLFFTLCAKALKSAFDVESKIFHFPHFVANEQSTNAFITLKRLACFSRNPLPPTLGAASVQRLVTNAVCPFRVDQQTATQNCMPQLQRTQLARKRVGSDNDVCCDDAADDSNVPGRDGNRATPCPTKRPRKLDLAGTTAPDARDSSRAIFASRLRCPSRSAQHC